MWEVNPLQLWRKNVRQICCFETHQESEGARVGRKIHNPIEGEVERDERRQPLEGWKLMVKHNHAGSFMLYGGHLKLVVSIFLRIDLHYERPN